MEVIPLEIWREIFSFRTYEDLVLSGSEDIVELTRALKKQYKTRSIIDYIYLMIKKEQIFYIPDSVLKKIWKKIPYKGHKFLYLTQEIIEKYEWDWVKLSENPSLRPEIIIKYEDKWSWILLSENPCLTSEIIIKYEDKWDWDYLSENPSLTPEIIIKYEDKWNWRRISQNPSLTPELKKKYNIE